MQQVDLGHQDASVMHVRRRRFGVRAACLLRAGRAHERRRDTAMATWRAVPGRTVELDAATHADQDEIAMVDVVAVGTGRRVLTLSPGRS